MPDNLWPSEVPSFKDTFQELFATFDRAGLKVLKAIARYLKIDEDYFEDAVRDGNSVLRALHYPPQTEPTGEHIRAGAHEDINAITLAARRRGSGAGAADPRRPLDPGLTQARRAGDQHRRHAAAADQRQAALDHAPRRQPDARPREQGALLDALLPPLPLGFPDRGAAGTVPAGEQPKWPPITANDYLQERLREIKLV